MEKTGAAKGAAGKHASPDGFRLDINALRALSVIAVVGFHFQIPGFAGGFVGVDVFLVITGYLMTAKVLNELKLGRFSPWTFWMMRMRRIYPALAVLTIASVVVGWFVTLPAEYLRHLLQALSALTFLSNFAFKSDSGYFAMAAQTKPLLHTWSLSLEWQFYFCMPLVVGLVWRLASRAMSGINAVVVALQAFAALSLAWCLWASQQDATGSSFFSLQARAWEPLAGGLIAAAEIRRRSEGIADPSWLQSPLVALAGWVLVAGCIVYPLPEARWPGVLTILPILGSAMIIAARQGSREGGLLGASAIQRVGDWSYSIYLWHWPVWVFALSWLSVRGYGVGATQKTLMVLALAGARRDFLPLCRAALQNSPGFLDAAQAAGGLRRRVRGVGGLRIADFSQQGFSGQAAGISVARRTGEKNQHAAGRVLQERELHQEGDRDLLQFRQRAGRRQAVRDPVGRFLCQPVSRTDFVGCARQRHPRTDRDAKRVQGLRRRCGEPTQAMQPPCRQFNRSTLDFVLAQAEPSIVVLGSNWANAAEISALDGPPAFGGQDRRRDHAVTEHRLRPAAAVDRKPDPRRPRHR